MVQSHPNKYYIFNWKGLHIQKIISLAYEPALRELNCQPTQQQGELSGCHQVRCLKDAIQLMQQQWTLLKTPGPCWCFLECTRMRRNRTCICCCISHQWNSSESLSRYKRQSILPNRSQETSTCHSNTTNNWFILIVRKLLASKTPANNISHSCRGNFWRNYTYTRIWQRC